MFIKYEQYTGVDQSAARAATGAQQGGGMCGGSGTHGENGGASDATLLLVKRQERLQIRLATAL